MQPSDKKKVLVLTAAFASFIHLFWNMPHVQVGGILGGIALPPALLHGIQPDYGAQLREHFGHSSGHWIDPNMPHGRFPLWQLLRQYPEVAHPQCRDIAPLRLVSRCLVKFRPGFNRSFIS